MPLTRFGIFILCFLMLAVNLYSATIYVDDTLGNDAWDGTESQPKKSISAAISIAADFDVIMVRAGTYAGADNRNLQPGAKQIIIQSESGPQATILDAQREDRIFYLLSSPATAKIQGFTLRNGFNEDLPTYSGGGAIFMNLSSCTIEECIFEDNYAWSGGAMIIHDSNAVMRNCIFRNNILSHEYYAVHGAAITLYDNTGVTFENCIFSGNRVEYIGYNGAAIFKYGGTDTFNNCIFEGNYARSNGGVMYTGRGQSTFNKCVFYGNKSDLNAACFFIVYITGQLPVPKVILKNSIFWDNYSVYTPIAEVRAGAEIHYSYCNIDPDGIDGYGARFVSGENFYTDPLFAVEGYYNGSQWIQGDYHLKSKVERYNPFTQNWVTDSQHSPCIDAADPNDAYDNEPQPNGLRTNMGSYGNTDEASKAPTCQSPIDADLTGDCRVDFADFAEFAGSWLECNIIPQQFCW